MKGIEAAIPANRKEREFDEILEVLDAKINYARELGSRLEETCHRLSGTNSPSTESGVEEAPTFGVTPRLRAGLGELDDALDRINRFASMLDAL